MQKLLLFGTAIAITVGAYIGLKSDSAVEGVAVKETQNTTPIASVEVSEKKNSIPSIAEIKKETPVVEIAETPKAKQENIKKKKKVIKAKSIITQSPQEDSVSTNQAAVNTISANLKKEATTIKTKKYTTSISLVGTTDFKETSDNSKSYAGKTNFGLGYQVNKSYRLSLTTSLSKDLSNSYEEKLNNTYLSLRHNPMKFVGETLLIPSITGIYPTNKDSKVRDEMLGALSVSPVVFQQFDAAFSAFYVPSVVAYSHKYKTNRVNATNNQYTVSQTLGLNYNFSDMLSASTSYTFVQSWSYYETEKDRQYSTNLSLTYSLTGGSGAAVTRVGQPRSNLTAGINTGGLLYQAEQGPDSNVRFYDPRSTAFYLIYGITL